MGAWNEENFGNDDACDWVSLLVESRGTSVLLMPIDLVNTKQGYLESYECSEALAVAEVIAAALTNDYSCVPESIIKWLNEKPGFFARKPLIKNEYANMARLAVEKIIGDSELKELWQESDHYERWRYIQQKLLAKLVDTHSRS